MALIQLAASWLFALEQETNFSPIYTAYLRNKLITVIKSHSHSVQHTSVTPGRDKCTQLASWTVPSKQPNCNLLFCWLSSLGDEAKPSLQIPPPASAVYLSRKQIAATKHSSKTAQFTARQPGDRKEEQGAICWCFSSCGQGQGQLVAPSVQAVQQLGWRWSGHAKAQTCH